MANNNNVRAHSFATVQLPRMVEQYGKDWISYGGDNLFPNFIIEMFNKSAINRRCINAKSDATAGKGFTLQDPAKNYILKKANPVESWDDVLAKIALDYVMFGGYALNIIWSKDGKTIAEFYHLDFSKVRCNKINDEDEITTFFYSCDWTNPRKFKPKRYCNFDPGKALDAVENNNTDNLSQILYVKNYNPNQVYYPLPEYAGSMNDIQLDIETSVFHLSNLSNGMTPSLWINMKGGDPGPEGRAKLYEELSQSFSGAENGGRFILTFSQGDEDASSVTPISLSNDNYYSGLEERVTSRILSGHGISSPLLLGLRVGASGLGSNKDEIIVAWQHFQFTVIRPIQKQVLSTFNTLLYYKGYPQDTLTIVPEAVFQDSEAIDTTSPTQP